MGKSKASIAKGKTRLGLQQKKDGDFSAWYSEVILKAEMIEYYDVSGCYILRPWAYNIWEHIQGWFDTKIKEHGVKNAYFPVFVSKAALEAEKDHVEGFAPEVAWVTHSGESELAKPVAIRPTSETIMYPAFSKWIRSHRDLPLRLNQWTNIVRWEFKNPTPFIRTREFLWQEGHTAHATREEAAEEVIFALGLYKRVYEDLLAVPVIRGRKSEKEKFAGGLYTTTVEGFIPTNGRAIQAATSHHLGQNFAKMFGIGFLDEAGEKGLVWQTSWGLTTRSIGVCVMVHGDDMGLVLPPKVAPVQVVVMAIVKASMSVQEKGKLSERARLIAEELAQAGIRAEFDDRDNYTAAWKYAHWEQKGVPIRLELGPRDMASESVFLARRCDGKKISASWDGLDKFVLDQLDDIQRTMLEKARKERDEKLSVVLSWKDFVPELNKGNMILMPWCEHRECEEEVKRRTQEAAEEMATAEKGEEEEEEAKKALSGAAKTLCIPFDQPPMEEGTKCPVCGRAAVSMTLWGRSY